MARSKVDKKLTRKLGGFETGVSIHRPTLKQKNKPFKDSQKKGPKRVALTKIPAPIATKKLDRINETTDRRRGKAAKVKSEKTAEIKKGVPRLVAIIPVHHTANQAAFRRTFIESFVTHEVDKTYDGQSPSIESVSQPLSNETLHIEMLTTPLPKWAARTGHIQFAMCPNIGGESFENVTPDAAHTQICALLDICKVADITLFLFGDCALDDAGFGKFGNEFLSLLKQQGLPLVVGVSGGIGSTMADEPSSNKKSKGANWGLVQRAFMTEFGRKNAIFNLAEFMEATGSIKAADFPPYNSSVCMEANKLLRHLVSAPLSPLAWRDSKRSYILAESAIYNQERNSLIVRGYARGLMGFSNLYPVHISGVGDFPVKSVAVGPTSDQSLESFTAISSWDMDPRIEEFFRKKVWAPYPDENAADVAAAEATDEKATDADMWDAVNKDHGDNFSDEDELNGEDGDKGSEEMNDSQLSEGSDEEFSDEDIESEFTAETSTATASRLLQERSRVDMEFDDEVDTPNDIRAALRFKRYRHLENFRNDDWDESQDKWESVSKGINKNFLKKLWSISGYVKTLNELNDRYVNALAQERVKFDTVKHSDKPNGIKKDQSTSMGSFVCLELSLDKSFIEHETDRNSFAQIRSLLDSGAVSAMDSSSSLLRRSVARIPLVISSLHPIERKISVQHFSGMKWGDVRNVPIPSKAQLRFQCGFRRWSGRPIFSEPLLSSRGATVISRECRIPALHKLHYKRFMSDSDKNKTILSMVSSSIAIRSPLIMWLESISPKMEPEIMERIERFNADIVEGTITKSISMIQQYASVGYGEFITTDPSRLIIKRILMTGYPHKIKKKKCTIHRMFNNREDVEEFSSARLFTKRSRQGRILCPIGTHGVIKCMFSDSLDHNDTVCLPLFKRILPPPPPELQLALGSTLPATTPLP